MDWIRLDHKFLASIINKIYGMDHKLLPSIIGSTILKDHNFLESVLGSMVGIINRSYRPS